MFFFCVSQCNRTESFKSFFKQILLEPTKIAVIGSGCSPATEPTAEVSSFYNITHVSNANVRKLVIFISKTSFPESPHIILSELRNLAMLIYGVDSTKCYKDAVLASRRGSKCFKEGVLNVVF